MCAFVRVCVRAHAFVRAGVRMFESTRVHASDDVDIADSPLHMAATTFGAME